MEQGDTKYNLQLEDSSLFQRRSHQTESQNDYASIENESAKNKTKNEERKSSSSLKKAYSIHDGNTFSFSLSMLGDEALQEKFKNLYLEKLDLKSAINENPPNLNPDEIDKKKKK